MHLNKYKVRLKGTMIQRPFDGKHPFRFRYIGQVPYVGFDDNGCITINCKSMDIIEISRTKAKQLKIDFPKLWAYLGSTTGESI